MFNATTILLLLALPVAGSLLVSLVPVKESLVSRLLSMVTMLVVLGLSIGIFNQFNGSVDPKILDLNTPWIASLGVNFHLAVDGLNVYLLLLTALLFPVVLLCTWQSLPAKRNLYMAMLLLLETSLLGTFLCQNMVLFYVFWEVVLIPMFILILVFGGENRSKAAMSFFLYTMVGSILLLAAIILLGVESLHQTGTWSFEFATLYQLHLAWGVELFVFVAIMLACVIKCPLFPFHSWLPLAYYEAPAGGTALLAGLLSKMGAFGLIKLAIPLCPQVSAVAAPYIMIMAVISILYGAVLALRQENFKKLVAYSSLSHMGYIVLGIFSFQEAAVHGALIQILSHGVAVAGLFLLLGMLEERLGDSYKQLGALSTYAPRLAVMLMLFILTSVALPLTSGFTAEFLILFGTFQQGLAVWLGNAGSLPLVAVLLACTGMVLGATYMLRFARVILYGTTRSGISVIDMNFRETLAFIPLLFMIIWIGIYPSPLMDKVQSAVIQLTTHAAGIQVPAVIAAPLTSPVIGGTTNGH